MKIGEAIEIWADDLTVERDIQNLVRRLGHEMHVVEEFMGHELE